MGVACRIGISFSAAATNATAQKTEKTLEGDLRPMISNGS
jgi:hypothetical protein